MFLMVLTGKTQSFEENWIDGWGSWSIVVQSGMACEEKVKSQSVGSQALNAWPMTHGTAWTFATYFTAQRSMPDFLRGVRGNMMENDGNVATKWGEMQKEFIHRKSLDSLVELVEQMWCHGGARCGVQILLVICQSPRCRSGVTGIRNYPTRWYPILNPLRITVCKDHPIKSVTSWHITINHSVVKCGNGKSPINKG